MKISNILMKPELVRASLDGLKTNTRRLRGLREVNQNPDEWHLLRAGVCSAEGHQHQGKFGAFFHRPGNTRFIPCPWGGPGDLVYVRETHHLSHHTLVTYRSDFDYDPFSEDECGEDCSMVGEKWRPSIHMPRWASRLTLRLTEVRVERLQDISEEDAISEGVWTANPSSGRTSPNVHHVSAFASLWESINGPGSWDANPWLWVLAYEPIAMNVDQVLKEAA